MDADNLLVKLLITHFISYDETYKLPRVALNGWAEVTEEEFAYIKSIRPTDDDGLSADPEDPALLMDKNSDMRE